MNRSAIGLFSRGRHALFCCPQVLQLDRGIVVLQNCSMYDRLDRGALSRCRRDDYWDCLRCAWLLCNGNATRSTMVWRRFPLSR